MSLSLLLKAVEINVRVIVLVFHLLAFFGGFLLIGYFDIKDEHKFGFVGGVTITVAGILSVYEIFMTVFALVKNTNVNHPVRLLVDIILNSAIAGLTVLASIGFIILAAIHRSAYFTLPIIHSIITSILCIGSAICAGIIHSKLMNEAEQSSQPADVVIAPPSRQNFVLVQQSSTIGQGANNPPSYDTTVSAPPMPVPGVPEANSNSNYQAGYQAGYLAGTKDKNLQDPTSYGLLPGVPIP